MHDGAWWSDDSGAGDLFFWGPDFVGQRWSENEIPRYQSLTKMYVINSEYVINLYIMYTSIKI